MRDELARDPIQIRDNHSGEQHSLTEKLFKEASGQVPNQSITNINSLLWTLANAGIELPPEYIKGLYLRGFEIPHSIAPQVQLTGGEACIRGLREGGVSTVFGLPGGHNLPLFRSFESVPELKVMGSRTEQGLGLAAVGYARTSRSPGVIVTTAGPGVTNVLTALGEARAEGAPVLLLALANFQSTLGSEGGFFHELPNSDSILRAFDTSYARVNRPSEMIYYIRQALYRLENDRPKPSIIEIPADILSQSFQHQINYSPIVASSRLAAGDVIERAAEVINGSSRPIILAGRGSLGAASELETFSQSISANVITTAQGRGATSDDYPLSLGCIWDRVRSVDSIAREADLVIALGTSLSRLSTREGRLPISGKIIHVDLNPGVIGRSYQPEIGIVADVKTILSQLLESDLVYRDCNQTFLDRTSELKNAFWQSFNEKVPSIARTLNEIRAACPITTKFVVDMTILGYWAQRFLPVFGPNQMMASYYFGNLGAGIPMALGAKKASPETPVVCIVGDGGFQYASQELSTACQESLPIVVLLFNDQAYGAVRADYKRMFGVSTENFGLRNPNFVQLAHSLGCYATRIEPGGLGEAIREVIGLDVPSVIEITLEEPFPSPTEILWDPL